MLRQPPAPLDERKTAVREWREAKHAVAEAESAVLAARHALKAAGEGRSAGRLQKALKRAEAALSRARQREKKFGRIAHQAAQVAKTCLRLVPQAAAYEAERRAARPKKRKRAVARPKLASELRVVVDALVPSPMGREHGVDLVERPLPTIELMFRRHQLNQRQFCAAEIYQHAYETLPDAIRCALALGSGGSPGLRTPQPRQLMAADTLRKAREILGRIDGRVIQLVCGEGHTIAKAAERMRGQPTQRAVDEIGARLRHGLTELARKWLPEPWCGLKAFALPDARPTMAATGGRVFPQAVAHAGPRKVDYAGTEHAAKKAHGRA